MALIKCPECGKEVSDSASSCPNCGHPISQTQAPKVDVTIKNEQPEKYHAPLSTLRLVVGIFSIVFSPIILFQSAAAGIVNAIDATGDVGGSAGLLVAMIFIAAGITGIATRNSRGRGGAIACIIMYVFAWLLGVSNSAVYSDLSIWGGLAAIFAIIFLIAGIRTKKQK